MADACDHAISARRHAGARGSNWPTLTHRTGGLGGQGETTRQPHRHRGSRAEEPDEEARSQMSLIVNEIYRERLAKHGL
ncbi:hypothetical protein I3I95_12195 [bacterium]|nr:hypothetical protein [bacterium]